MRKPPMNGRKNVRAMSRTKRRRDSNSEKTRRWEKFQR